MENLHDRRDELTVTRFFSTECEDLFRYFTDPVLLEQWCYPEGMTLHIPQLDVRVGGKYRYEHSNDSGVYVCVGHFKELIPNKKIVQVDEIVTNPKGEVTFHNLEGTTEFVNTMRGTEIFLTYKGFSDDQSLRECEEGCIQSLDKLSNILAIKTRGNSDFRETNVRS